MDDLFINKNKGQVILGVIFILYLLMGFKTPNSVAHIIDHPIGKIAILFTVLLLFMKTHPLLGVLGLFVAFHLISQSSVSTGSFAVNNYVPTEEKKYNAMTQYNQFPYTLEQEIVKKMAPLNNVGNVTAAESKFAPVLDDLHDAAPIGYKGVA